MLFQLSFFSGTVSVFLFYFSVSVTVTVIYYFSVTIAVTVIYIFFSVILPVTVDRNNTDMNTTLAELLVNDDHIILS